MTAHGHFHWNELLAYDTAGARKFYEDTLDLTFNEMDMPEGKYFIAMDGEQPLFGIMKMPEIVADGVPEHWQPYIAVDDIDARFDKAKAAGAKVIREPFDVPGIGRIAIMFEPGGALMGWMTPADGTAS